MKRDLDHFGLLMDFLPPARPSNHTLSKFAWYRVLLNDNHLHEPMDEASQTPSGYSEQNHMQNPQTLPHLLHDKTALWIKSSLIFLFRDFIHGFVTDSHKDHIGALYFLWLVHTWRLEFIFQLFCVQNSFLTSQFWAYIWSKAFLGCRLGEKWDTAHMLTAFCPVPLDNISSTAAHVLLLKADGQIKADGQTGDMKTLSTAIDWGCPSATGDNWHLRSNQEDL